MNCKSFRQDHFVEKGHIVRAKNAFKESRLSPFSMARLPCATRSPPSRGMEREVGTCTAKANARAKEGGGGGVFDQNAFFGLMEAASYVCRLFGVIMWEKGNLGCPFREKSFFCS